MDIVIDPGTGTPVLSFYGEGGIAPQNKRAIIQNDPTGTFIDTYTATGGFIASHIKAGSDGTIQLYGTDANGSNGPSIFLDRSNIQFADTNGELAATRYNSSKKVLEVAGESWHTVTLASGWTHVAGNPVQYTKRPDGRVELRGEAVSPTTTSSGGNVFTLPAGYLPAAGGSLQWVAAMPGSNNFQKVIVTTAGAVNIGLGYTASFNLNFSPVSFPTR
jgi:hypothetical protein